jgi:hypothetical protein
MVSLIKITERWILARIIHKIFLSIEFGLTRKIHLLLRAFYKLTEIGYFEPNSIWYYQLVSRSE